MYFVIMKGANFARIIGELSVGGGTSYLRERGEYSTRSSSFCLAAD